MVKLTEQQKEEIIQMLHTAFIELRYLEQDQANDLAYALHNVPLLLSETPNTEPRLIKFSLAQYQAKYPEKCFNYLSEFERIIIQG